VITWFTVGNQPTLPTYIYTKVKFGVTPEVNAVATVMLFATLLIFGIARLVLGRAARAGRRAAPPDRMSRADARRRLQGRRCRRARGRPRAKGRADDDVVIDVEACGSAGTDLQILNVPAGSPGRRRVVMGHEFIGRVSAVGANAGASGRQRVTRRPDPKCGVCGPCRAGRPASCENVRALGIFRDGPWRAKVKAPAHAVFPLSDVPPARIAALIEPLACVGERR
jgi:hypothetical protein